jgi:ArsR family transcriptional regulator
MFISCDPWLVEIGVTQDRVSFEDCVAALKAAAEPTRLRILLLLSEIGELNVKDLTSVLGQSQPRLSRHLKLLTEAGLVDRIREGSFAYFQASDRGDVQRLLRRLLGAVDGDDRVLRRDRQRARALRAEREAAAQRHFAEHAGEWDRIRALHVADSEVEAAMRALAPTAGVDLMVDLGTGTGRMLEVFADLYARAIGVDVSHEMLAYARSRVTAAGLAHVQVRHGDLYHLALADGAADLVVMHQVLHFLSDPRAALLEARRVLAPGGTLIVVDFAPHDLEALREAQAHERLGFSHMQVAHWLAEAGIEAVAIRDLPPPAGASDKLTVTLWHGRRAVERRRIPRAPEATRTPLEIR